MIGNSIRRVLTVCLCLQAITTPTKAQYSGGRGVADDPYRIANAADLIALGETPDDYDKHFVLTADIDLSGHTSDRAVIAPKAGIEDPVFCGVFDGKGRTIKNLTIDTLSDADPSNDAEDCLGLFGRCRQAVVRNLSLEQASIRCGDSRYVGGLCGRSEGSAISRCVFEGAVRSGSRSQYVGGLVGESGWFWTSGVFPDPEGRFMIGQVEQSSVRGTVAGGTNVGGLVGKSIVSLIVMSFADAEVTGTSDVGGLLGAHQGHTAIANCHSTGSVSGQTNIGGLIGYSSTNDMDEGIVNCYAACRVRGDSQIGGLVGYATEDEVFHGCFWDMDVCGLVVSDGGTGLHTGELQDENTFVAAGWDFEWPIWSIVADEYPHLVWSRSESCDGGAADRIFEICIDAGVDYEDPGVTGDDTHEFSLEVRTDSCVARIEFITPSGELFEIPPLPICELEHEEGMTETGREFDVLESAWLWIYYVELTEPAALARFEDGVYRIVLHFEDGRSETVDVPFGTTGSGADLFVPDRPVLTSCTYTGGLLTLEWESFALAEEGLLYGTVVEMEHEVTGEEIEWEIDGDVTHLTEPILVSAGQWQVELTHMVGYEDLTEQGISVLCCKWSESDYTCFLGREAQ